MSGASTTTTYAGAPVGAPGAAAPGEACPLCGAPLHPQQDWCLSCGAAARTRLAAAPNWKAPAATLAVVGALSLGVLAAALVELAAGSPAKAPVTATRTVTSPPALTPTQPSEAQGNLPGASGSTTGVPGTSGTTVTGSTSSTPTLGSRSTHTSTHPGQFDVRKRIEERLRRRGLAPGTPVG